MRRLSAFHPTGAALCASLVWAGAHAQTPTASPTAPPAPTDPNTRSTEQRITELENEVLELKALVHQLQDQLGNGTPAPAQSASAAANAPPPPASTPATPAPAATAATPATAATAATAAGAAGLLQGITVNATMDGYYEYNFNAPIGRVNYLRAYDVSSNSFSLNQADVVLERAPDPANDRRFGMRLDLQFGQATSTLQGNPANELRPDVYRNVFQAYGTYVFPVAAGLTVDFGKWASSLGIEGNYTKDQLNYSRSFWFDYLPFYHSGLRSKLAINDQVAVNLWIANGTNETEADNNYKDQLLGITLTPTPALSWTLNFYQGQEHPDVIYLQNPTPAELSLPNVQGTYILPITNPPDGKLQIVDTYISWAASQSLQFAAEADYVQERLFSYSAAQHVAGGAIYAGYQLSSTLALAARAEYLADVGGLYTGYTQYLKEGTLTFDYRPADGFLLRGELRRDQSNMPFFLGASLGNLHSIQPTVGVGVVWWFGQKPGPW